MFRAGKLSARDIQRWRRAGGSLLLLAILAVVLALTTWAVKGAVELAYYNATSTADSVLLGWATVSEVNLAGFEIQCKRADEMDTDYHTIGSRIAQGGPDQGATYSFQVTSGLVAGTAYCFRLKEVTSDGVPGEQFDLCGYGPGVTPTPVGAATGITGTVAITGAAGVTTTTIVVQPPAGLTPAATFDFTQLTPAAPELSPLTTPTSAFESPLFDEFGSPIATPTPTVFAFDAGAATLDAQALALSQEATPTPTIAEIVMSEAPTSLPMPVEEFAETPPAIAEVPTVPPRTDGLDTAALEAATTPTPLYIVVTATPTSEQVALLPTLTAFPTASPTPDLGVLALFRPNAQNMMVMLLCLFFLTFAGLGTLGLVTSIIYMRSQVPRDRYPDIYYGRRRRL